MPGFNDLAKALREDEERDRKANQKQNKKSGWSPRTTGYVNGYHEVTFRQGKGSNSGHTLIADGGNRSARDFDKNHDHYGQNRENSGRVEDEGGYRGNYTGPGK